MTHRVSNTTGSMPGAGLILASFFLSGGAALIYEVLWVRLVSLFCGHTALATSAVLAAFMGGLAAGSWIGGRIADTLPRRRLLALYILLELGIAAAGLMTKPALALAGGLALQLGVIELAPALQSAVYFGLSFTVLLFPTTLMGASLPVLTRWMSLREEPPDAPLSLLYGLNTLGAVLGAVTAGFLLMPMLGTAKSLLCAAGVNVVCAGLGFVVWRGKGVVHGEDASRPSRTAVVPGAPLAVPRRRAVVLLFLAGAAAMVCEVAWTRAFSLVMGSTTYAFTVMLATFLLGLSLGSMAFHVLRRRFAASWGGLSALLALVGVSVFSGLFIFERLPYLLNIYQHRFFTDPGIVFAVQFLLAAIIMLVPTTLMGAVLPWAAACARPDRERIGSETGIFYAANTLGAILGSTATGLFLLPSADIERSLVIAVWLYGAAALTALGAARFGARARYSTWAAAAVVLSAMTALRPAWNMRLFGAGGLVGGAADSAAGFEKFKASYSQHKIIFHRSGVNATVTVFEQPFGGRYLRINGKVDASEGGDMGTQFLLGYLPLLLHGGEPKSALVVGLGGGVTAGALASDPGLERLDVVEIEPLVVEGARLFARSNHHVLDDPRLRLHFADARQFLAAPGPDYDIISSEPSNPWIAGIAYLYTREAFALVRERLADDGVFVQWIHGYRMSEEDFKMVVRTFLSVFPHAMVFSNGDSDYFLIGSKSPWDIDFADIERAFAENRTMREDLAVMGKGFDHPVTLLLLSFLIDGEDLHRYAQGAPIHTDDLPSLEFSAAKNMYIKGGAHDIIKHVDATAKKALPRGLKGLVLVDSLRAVAFNTACERLLDANLLEEAALNLGKAMKLDPASAYAWTNRGRIFEERGDPQNALAAYARAVSYDPNFAKVRVRLGLLHESQGRDVKALAEFQKALELRPGDPMASLGVGWIYVKQGKKAEARRLLESALDRPIPDSIVRSQLFDTLELSRE